MVKLVGRMFGLVNAIKIGKLPREVGGKNCERFSKNGLIIISVLSVLKRKHHVSNLPKKITLISGNV